MAVFETWLHYDLQEQLKPVIFDGAIFTEDNKANLFGVELTDGGEPATLTGTVSGCVIKSNGITTAVDGGHLEGNRAWIVLPQAAYEVPGQVTINIILTDGTTETTIGSCIITVLRRQTGTIEDSGTIIPSVNSLISLIETTAATIPEEYSDLNNNVKRADTELRESFGYLPMVWEQGRITSSGDSSSSKYIRTAGFLTGVGNGDMIEYHVADGLWMTVYAYTAAGTYLGGIATLTESGIYHIKTNYTAKLRFVITKENDDDIVPKEGYTGAYVRLVQTGGSVYDNINSIVKGDALSFYWEQGSLTSDGESSSSNLIRTHGYLPTGMIGAIKAVKNDSVYSLRVYEYKIGGDGVTPSYVGYKTMQSNQPVWLEPETRFIRLRLALTAGTAITPDYGANVACSIVSGRQSFSDRVNFAWEQGTLTSSGEDTGTTYIRTSGYTNIGPMRVMKTVKLDSVYTVNLFEYKYASDGTTPVYISDRAVSDGERVWLHPKTQLIRLRAALVAGTDITPVYGNNIQCYMLPETGLYITPQMFGAKGDGTTDDTAAFQAALNSGYDVYVPTMLGEKYLITSMLYIPNSCKRIYGDVSPRGTSTVGSILFDPKQAPGGADMSVAQLRNKALFYLGTDSTAAHGAEAVTISGLTIACTSKDGSRIGLCIDATNLLCDKDLTLSNVTITNFYRIINFFGRGFTVINSGLTSSNYVGTFNWDDAYDSNRNHPADMNQRAILFKNSRLHSITNQLINIASGHAYGLTISGCTMDVGRGQIVNCEEKAFNWLIEGNTFLGMYCRDTSGNSIGPAVDMKGGVQNCVITGNIFDARPDFWDSPAGDENMYKRIPNTYIRAGRTESGQQEAISGGRSLTVSGNTFRYSARSCIRLHEIENVAIVGNSFDTVGCEEQTDGAAIELTGTCSYLAINSNVMSTEADGGFIKDDEASISSSIFSDNAARGAM